MNGYSDSSYIILLVGVTLLGVFAQSRVKSTFNKFSKQATRSGKTGRDVANKLLRDHQCSETRVSSISGTLTDHYDPRQNVVNLSEGVYDSSSVSAIGVAAHECGHVMQHHEGYMPIRIRSALVPVVNIGSQAAWPIFFAGLVLQALGLMYLGIFLFSFALLFHLVTLPVELNASNRALDALREEAHLDEAELAGAQKVLRAAAMTYIVAALASAVQLLRYIGLATSRNRRR